MVPYVQDCLIIKVITEGISVEQPSKRHFVDHSPHIPRVFGFNLVDSPNLLGWNFQRHAKVGLALPYLVIYRAYTLIVWLNSLTGAALKNVLYEILLFDSLGLSYESDRVR